VARPGVVFNTDHAWFGHFRPTDGFTVVDEVNFWRPQAQNRFRALSTGEPLFFRLKHPIGAIAGFGFFALEIFLSVPTAWQTFGTKNGDPTRERFVRRITGYQQPGGDRLLETGQRQLSCLVLRDAVFLPQAEWMPWDGDMDWSRNIVSYKTYDLDAGAGVHLARLLTRRGEASIPDLLPDFVPLVADARTFDLAAVAGRVAQGTFRARLLDAYGGRCAVTGDHTLPVLDAAHIQRYLGPASNHVQNGLLLRTDLHRLYDFGYVTVTPNYHFAVSTRLRDEFDNGRAYYALDGTRIALPESAGARPSTAALAWHAENVFR